MNDEIFSEGVLVLNIDKCHIYYNCIATIDCRIGERAFDKDFDLFRVKANNNYYLLHRRDMRLMILGNNYDSILAANILEL
jgi:hypothetical protein